MSTVMAVLLFWGSAAHEENASSERSAWSQALDDVAFVLASLADI